MLLVGPNSAPNSGRIPPLEALAAPGVRIHPAPPASLQVFGDSLISCVKAQMWPEFGTPQRLNEGSSDEQ